MKFSLSKIIAHNKSSAPIDCPKVKHIFHAPLESDDAVSLLPVYRQLTSQGHVPRFDNTPKPPLTWPQIKKLFFQIKKYYEKSDLSMNCEARCFDIIQLLFILSQRPLKYQINSTIPIPLEVPTTGSSEMEWAYHVAPAVRSENGTVYVLDASLSAPLPESEWLGRVCGFNRYSVQPVFRALYLPNTFDPNTNETPLTTS